jgi:hypothetical protein
VADLEGDFFYRERDLAATATVGRGCGLQHHEDTTLHHGRCARGWMRLPSVAGLVR